MVSGFLTSPCDHSRIFSGDASEMRIALNESGSLGFSKKLKMSRIGTFPLSKSGCCVRILGLERRTSPPPEREGEGVESLLGRLITAKLAGLHELDVQAERLKLLDEHVEALRQTRLERVLTLHDGFVHASTTHDVVALDGEELLERVRSAVRFHGPHFHFT